MFKLKKYVIAIVVFIMLIGGICAPIKANASEITPYAYNDPYAVSFCENYTGKSLYYGGNYMAFETTSTASDGVSREIIISVYIASTNTTKKYRTYSDGVNIKADYIPIADGSYVVISASCYNCNSTNIFKVFKFIYISIYKFIN